MFISKIGDFVSSIEHKQKSVSHIMTVNGTHGFESQKTYVVFVCVLLKKQSHLHLGKQINITLAFFGELSL